MRPDRLRAPVLATVLLAGAVPAAAWAQNPWSGSATLASDNRSKGASKTGGRAQTAVSLERTVGPAAYIGASASNVRNSAGSDAQLNLSLGWTPRAFGLAWTLDSTHELYPGSDTDGNDVVWQISATASRETGPFAAAVTLQHQPDGFGATGANTYLAVSGAWSLGPRLQAVAGLGRREQVSSVDYSAWNAGLVGRLTEAVDLDVRWYATDQDAQGPNYQDRLVAALTLDF